MTQNFTRPGKASVIIDGQFGSTGKGLIAGFLALHNECTIATTNASANAGHTTIVGGRKFITYHLPTFAVMNPQCKAYLNAGAIINPAMLLREIEEVGINPEQVFIHPRAAIITPEMIEGEYHMGSAATKLGSTRKGVGTALAAKVMRSAKLAQDIPELKHFIRHIDLNEMLEWGDHVVVEIPQGYGLGLNSGLAYPYCTSRDVTIGQGLSDAGIHPMFLGKTMMTCRTYPIRVGNIYAENGDLLGSSGPCFEDQKEIRFADIGQVEELTTVTKRVRRIFTWSRDQYIDSLRMLRPDYVFLNFVNYCRNRAEFDVLYDSMRDDGMTPTHFGVGPSVEEVFTSHNIAGAKMGWES